MSSDIPCAFVLKNWMFWIGICLLKKQMCTDIEITFLMLLIIIENSLEGWTDVVSILVKEKKHYSLFSYS